MHCSCGATATGAPIAASSGTPSAAPRSTSAAAAQPAGSRPAHPTSKASPAPNAGPGAKTPSRSRSLYLTTCWSRSPPSNGLAAHSGFARGTPAMGLHRMEPADHLPRLIHRSAAWTSHTITPRQESSNIDVDPGRLHRGTIVTVADGSSHTHEWAERTSATVAPPPGMRSWPRPRLGRCDLPAPFPLATAAERGNCRTSASGRQTQASGPDGRPVSARSFAEHSLLRTRTGNPRPGESGAAGPPTIRVRLSRRRERANHARLRPTERRRRGTPSSAGRSPRAARLMLTTCVAALPLHNHDKGHQR